VDGWQAQDANLDWQNEGPDFRNCCQWALSSDAKAPDRLHEITGTLNIAAPDVRAALYGRNRSWDGGDEHVAPAPSIGGNTTVTLGDGSTVTLVGVSSINSSFFG
jgi:hypothetical protein